MTIDKLTDEERASLDETGEGEKALRIIDQLTEALATAEREQQRFEEACANGERVYDELAEKHRAAEARVRELEAAVNNECSLRVQATDAAFELRNHLAAANALLDFIREEIRVCEAEAEQRDPEDEVYIQADGYRHIRAHLSGQAKAEALTPEIQANADWVSQCSASGRHPDMREVRVSAAAEQRVLEAARRWVNEGAGRVSVELADACYALARREQIHRHPGVIIRGEPAPPAQPELARREAKR